MDVCFHALPSVPTLNVVVVKEYVNYVNMPEYGLDCQISHSKSCVVNDG